MKLKTDIICSSRLEAITIIITLYPALSVNWSTNLRLLLSTNSFVLNNQETFVICLTLSWSDSLIAFVTYSHAYREQRCRHVAASWNSSSRWIDIELWRPTAPSSVERSVATNSAGCRWPPSTGNATTWRRLSTSTGSGTVTCCRRTNTSRTWFASPAPW